MCDRQKIVHASANPDVVVPVVTLRELLTLVARVVSSLWPSCYVVIISRCGSSCEWGVVASRPAEIETVNLTQPATKFQQSLGGGIHAAPVVLIGEARHVIVCIELIEVNLLEEPSPNWSLLARVALPPLFP